MKAMVLAAGLGTRLRPLTNDRPKALVEVAGRTMIELVLERLRSSGVGEVIVNVHHYADMVADYLHSNGDFGMRIEISREADLLDTGGGLKKAAWFFLESSMASTEPFIVHNVDVMSAIDLNQMVRFHLDNDALATLAVQNRPTSRPLLFDGQGRLQGRAAPQSKQAETNQAPVRSAPPMQALGFSGIHVVSPRLFAQLQEEGAFSIVDAYVRLANAGERIIAFRADDYEWRDLGRPEQVAEAARALAGASGSAHTTRKSEPPR